MKKWGMLISVLIIIGMITIVIITRQEIKKETGGIPGYESAMMKDMSKDELADVPEEWRVAEGDDSGTGDVSETTGLARGDLAPDFELTTLAGETVKLSDYRGKKVMLNFWGSWCPPCRIEMPHMQTYYNEYKESSNMEILAVNMTKKEVKKEESAKEFVEEYGLTFPILLDVDGEVVETYRVKAYPTTYILNTEGVITDIVVSGIDDKFLKKIIDESK
ncbi:peroxiredoxin family protein [Sporosarcina cascadiensis]|uniref:peroxiredoxin family protein n=1 Tax=Sporosarcina cascadiensis TaxID=2660747 RepID=UPI0018913E13|nr:redoxin domain-containing protein [Sporosarcina cascadiensis]